MIRRSRSRPTDSQLAGSGVPGGPRTHTSAGVLVVVSLAVAGAFLGPATDPTVAAPPAEPKVTVEQTERWCGFVGRVVDAETGKPVEKFAIKTGWTNKPVADTKDIPWYSTTHTAGGHRGGKFSVTHSLPDDRQQFVYFRILADGYVPHLVSDKGLSRPLRYRGVVVRLSRGQSILGRVLDATGKPVAGAGVFLVSRQRPLSLGDGKPEHFTGSSGTTDKDGRFKLPGAGAMTTHVVVSCKSLHAWLTPIPKAGEEFTVKLPAPARLVMKHDIPGAATEYIRVCLTTWDMPEWKGQVHDVVQKPDVAKDGTVTLSNVTPGTYDIFRYVTTRVGDRGQGAFLDRQWVELERGQTTHIEFVRKTGVAIVGDIPGLAANGCPGAFIRVEELTVRPGRPHRSLGPTTLDAVACGPDGRFKTSRIPPGRVRVTATAYVPEGPTGRSRSGIRRPTFVGSTEVAVPAAGEPVRVRVWMGPWQHPRRPAKAPASPATDAARQQCWQELASPAYASSAGAAARLGAGGEKAAKLLSGKLLIPTANPTRVSQRVAELDSPQYQVRKKAQGDLKALGLAALPALRAATRGKLTSEAETRIKALLAREPVLLMRMERAIDVLARLDRPGCLAVLRGLAARGPGAPATRLAKARLQALLTQPAKPDNEGR